MAAERNLRNAGIELPFPQRTLSLDRATERLLAPTELDMTDEDHRQRSRTS